MIKMSILKSPTPEIKLGT
uniref:Uncharacterized protein n=1 Tax=Rhizophora mucronata TaxID=61149 RepID=A0A2P2N294_RHIMU